MHELNLQEIIQDSKETEANYKQMEAVLLEQGASKEVIDFATRIYGISVETYENILYYYCGTDNFTAFTED